MKKFFFLVFLCLVFLLQGCGESEAEKEKVDIKNAIPTAINSGGFSIIPTGAKAVSTADGDYLPSFDQLKKFNEIIDKFEKEKKVKVINRSIEITWDAEIYLLTINQSIQPADSTIKILINQNKQLVKEVKKLQKMVAKNQREFKEYSIKLDSIQTWLYNE
jgi:hypothetical protein